MYKSKKTNFIFLLVLILYLSAFNPMFIEGNFYLGSIEDEEDWFVETKKLDFHDAFEANINFAFGNTSLGFATYLTFNSEITAPLNVTGFLNRKIKKDSSTVGIRVNGEEGQVIVGLNGTVLLAVNESIVPLEFEQDTVNSYTNFSTIFGQNISLPINVNPISFEIPTESILPNLFFDQIKLSIQPVLVLTGSISFSAEVMNETLTWKTGEEIYFRNVEVSKEQMNYSISLEQLRYNFTEVKMKLTSINSVVTFSSETFGDLYSAEFDIDLESIDNSSDNPAIDNLAVFLLDNLIELEDTEILISIEKTPFNSLGLILLMLLALSAYNVLKKRRPSF